MEQFSGDKDEAGHVGMAAGGDTLLKRAAPYLQSLDPRRVSSVASVLRRLEILQKEGVALTMPEILRSNKRCFPAGASFDGLPRIEGWANHRQAGTGDTFP